VSEAKRRNRRLLLAGLGLGGLAMLAAPGWVRKRINQRIGTDCVHTDWVFRNSESARQVGRRYLAEVPEEAESEALESLLENSLGANAVGADSKALSTKIRRAIEMDFETSRVVYLDGWMLSETEARLCARRLLR